MFLCVELSAQPKFNDCYGRETELEVLEQCVDRLAQDKVREPFGVVSSRVPCLVRDTQGGVMFLTGDRGSGKTQLVERIIMHGALVVVARMLVACIVVYASAVGRVVVVVRGGADRAEAGKNMTVLRSQESAPPVTKTFSRTISVHVARYCTISLSSCSC